MKPETPPMTNSMMKPAKKRNGVLNTGRPVQIVAIQAKTATALGIAMTKLAAQKNDSDKRRQAGREHVVHPHAEAEDHRRDRRDRDRACSRPAAGGRTPAARRRQCPSPAARAHRPRGGRTSRTGAARAAAGRHPTTSKKCVPKLPVEPQHEEGEADRRHRQQIGRGCGERAPDEDRQPVDRHARRAHAQQRDDEVGRADRRSRCRERSGRALERPC